MAKTLEWLFQLDDRVTGPAKSILGSLDALDQKLKSVDSGLKGLGPAPAFSPSTAIAPKVQREAKGRFQIPGAEPVAAGGSTSPTGGVSRPAGATSASMPPAGAAAAWGDVDAKARALAATFAQLARSGPRVQPPPWMRQLDAARAESRRVGDARARLGGGKAPSVVAEAPPQLRAAGSVAQPAWMRAIGENQAMRAKSRELAAFGKTTQARSVEIGKSYQKILQPPKPTGGANVFKDLGAGILQGLGGGIILAGVAGIAAEAASKLVELGVKAVELVHAGVEFGVQAQSFRDATTTGFKIMTGSAQVGKDLTGEAMKLADKFGMESEAVAASFKSILGAKFEAKEVPVVFQALADVETIGGGKDAVLAGFASAMQEKRIHYEQVKALAAAANVPYNDVLDVMAKKYGRARLQLVRQLQGTIGLDPRLGVFGVIETLRKRMGGEVGRGVEEETTTLEKQLTRLRGAFGRAAGADIPTPGFDLFKSVVRGLADALGEGTPGAQKLEQVFTHLDGALANLFGRWSGPDGMKKLGEDVDQVLTRVERLAAVVEKLAKPLGFLLSAGATAALGPTEHSSAGEVAGGQAIRTGLSAGAMSIPTLGPLLAGPLLAAGLLGGSPSTGSGAPAGVPKMAAGGIVDKPTLAEVGHGREAIVPLSKGRRLIDDVLPPARGEGGGKTIVISPTISITVHSSGGEDAARLAEQLEPQVRRIVEDVMEDAARELGAEEAS